MSRLARLVLIGFGIGICAPIAFLLGLMWIIEPAPYDRRGDMEYWGGTFDGPPHSIAPVKP